MTRPSVYLAGPITGLGYDGVVEWREYVAKDLEDCGIVPYSPMRAKQFLKDIKSFSKAGEPGEGQLATGEAITTRDHWDCSTKDLIFVNFLGAKTVSIGTVMEIAWAHAYRKPVVLVMEKEGNPHDHAMLTQSGGHFRTDDLDEGIYFAKAILLPHP